MGKNFYKQKVGIPQGSVISTILCNIFFADLEKKKLPFLVDDDGLLLRLIDDFLYISMNKDHAKEFLQHMHDGTNSANPSDSRPSGIWLCCQHVQESDQF
jgi:telomerase reverse transcriptase